MPLPCHLITTSRPETVQVLEKRGCRVLLTTTQKREGEGRADDGEIREVFERSAPGGILTHVKCTLANTYLILVVAKMAAAPKAMGL